MRNANRTIAQLVEHMSHDSLVGWAWSSGAGRTPAPGSQAQIGALLDAWAASRCGVCVDLKELED